MEIVHKLSGFSLAEADLLRRMLGRRRSDEVEEWRSRFVQGAVEKGIEKAEKAFDFLEHYSGYTFSKAHAAAYATMAYQLSYLKANYPDEFKAALELMESEKSYP